ncbi:hypothetical protein BX286_7034 [Streptomyces sp. 3211.6]|uniref:hypothetical protein n=1 Tax=Streptomyces sp. 3211.6 TaxID=1938845 RepID=UPI000F2B5E07|nr:hypothetical protein [Streptomyces sp. 3211.6]RKS97220.1 hypothetical protein BX286_7034 [Streptomyces sp. 3211.6]
MSWSKKRAAATVAAGSIMAATAVGCSPAPKALLAVERTDTGGARVLIAPCPEYSAQMLSVSSSGGTIGFKRWSLVNDAMGGPLDSVELFSKPKGWSVAESELSDLKGGREYTVVLVGGVRGRGLGGEISFTPDEFVALKPGQVLVRDGKGSKAAKKSEFMKKNSDRCTPD